MISGFVEGRRKTFLGSLEEFAIRFEIEVDVDEL
jgi:hypothetical protein